ncbi:hypothetical protein [Haliscomenobacter sp.]|uniref:hypothetical protein n=1 Tax=Haliscomenobacter sp. TaxID=2717303 RepID=UPI0033651E2F
MQFYLRYAWCMRSFDHEDLDRRLENYYGRYRAGYSSGTYSPGTNAPSQADAQQRGDLHNMCDLLRALPKSCKIMIQYDHVFLYTNQLTTLEHMSQVEYIYRWLVGEAVIAYPKNTVMLQNPVHQYRTFLKSRWWDPDTSARIKKFLLGRQDLFRIPRGFCEKLERPGRLATRDHHFVDHDDPDLLLMLSLVCPGIINKTLPIQAK